MAGQSVNQVLGDKDCAAIATPPFYTAAIPDADRDLSEQLSHLPLRYESFVNV